MSTIGWWSLALGGGLGLLYNVSSAATLWWANRHTGNRFYAIALGGLIVRLFTALGAFALVIATMPVQRALFSGSFLAVALLGLLAEVAWIARRTLGGED